MIEKSRGKFQSLLDPFSRGQLVSAPTHTRTSWLCRLFATYVGRPDFVASPILRLQPQAPDAGYIYAPRLPTKANDITSARNSADIYEFTVL